MPIDDKVVQTYIKVKALTRSPNANEADVAARKLKEMETKYPGIEKIAERPPKPVVTPDNIADFFRKAYETINDFVDVVADSVQGLKEAQSVRFTRTTRGKATYLSLVFSTYSLLKVREMNDLQQQAYREELHRRLDEEIERLLED